MRSLCFVLIILLRIGPGPGLAADITNNSQSLPVDLSNPKETGMKIHEHRSGAWTPGLTDEEKATLLAIAKDTLAWCVSNPTGAKNPFSFESYALTPKLKTPLHTFVTLKIKGELRGCIGSLPPMEAWPLYRSVHQNAVSAALHDYRFSPVQPAELMAIEVDVSILSPVKDIPNLEAFTLGQHGIILSKGRSRAVFLPEVATEQHWTKEETLSHLSRKAGLSADAWRQGVQFQVFESVVLSPGK